MSVLRKNYSGISVHFPEAENMGKISTYKKFFFWSPWNFILLPP